MKSGWVAPLLGCLALACASLEEPRASSGACPPAPTELRAGGLAFEAPILRWDEALPLGNGLLGCLVWGEGSVLRLSLDRADLWDERVPELYRTSEWNYATMRRLQAAGDQTRLSELFDWTYDNLPYPTKLPGGRIELDFGPGREIRRFALDYATAEARVELADGSSVVLFVSAVEPCLLVECQGAAPEPRYLRPEGLDRLGYPPADGGVRHTPGERAWQWTQPTAEGAYRVLGRERAGLLELSIETDPEQLSHELFGARAQELASLPLQLRRGEHRAWWQRFYCASAVQLPDPAIAAQYELAKYLHGAGSRRGAPPLALQGVWTADEGGLPPWKGDYHHDLNTQTTYAAYATAGLFDSGRSLIDWHMRLLPNYQNFAREFFGVPGALVPGVASLHGNPLGGWGQYSLSPTNSAWCALAFEQHWRITQDPEFLRQVAYPWCREIGTALEALLVPAGPDAPASLRLALSSSPEIFDNSARAWLPPNSNYDQSLLLWLFGALDGMAEALGEQPEAQHWRALRQRLEPLDLDPADGALTFARGVPYEESHRHFSHAMAIHPLGLLTIEGGPQQRAVIEATLADLERFGTSAWCGYSFSWHACMLARCGRAEQALVRLEQFVSAFVLKNGFHANGDQSGSGLSGFTYRPFTLEGNMLAMQAVHEMLLQSWGGCVRLFPAVSERWPDVDFRGLWAEGGYRVSASRRGKSTQSLCIEDARPSGSGPALLRLRDPFQGRDVRWSQPAERTPEGDLVFTMRPGDRLSALTDPTLR